MFLVDYFNSINSNYKHTDLNLDKNIDIDMDLGGFRISRQDKDISIQLDDSFFSHG